MPILCGPAVRTGDAFLSIGGQVRAADDLHATAQMLDNDPAETLVVIGPETATSEALAFAAALRLARPTVGVTGGGVSGRPCGRERRLPSLSRCVAATAHRG